jgi:hypothetical protein
MKTEKKQNRKEKKYVWYEGTRNICEEKQNETNTKKDKETKEQNKIEKISQYFFFLRR